VLNQSCFISDPVQNQRSSGVGRRSPLQYEDGSLQQQHQQHQQQQQQQMHHLLPPRSSFVVNSSDYHIASFTKPSPTSSYVQGSSVVYTLSPPPARSPPMLAAQVPQASTMTSFPGPAMPVSPSLEAQSSSFTNTFLRGILSSIDSKDPVIKIVPRSQPLNVEVVGVGEGHCGLFISI
jgi:hypothetical protein